MICCQGFRLNIAEVDIQIIATCRDLLRTQWKTCHPFMWGPVFQKHITHPRKRVSASGARHCYSGKKTVLTLETRILAEWF